MRRFYSRRVETREGPLGHCSAKGKAGVLVSLGANLCWMRQKCRSFHYYLAKKGQIRYTFDLANKGSAGSLFSGTSHYWKKENLLITV